MGKYLKKFDNDPARVEYEGGSDYIEPYVSYVEGDNSVHYNKPETRLVVYYDIQDISAPTTIWTNYDGGVVRSIDVDGTLLDSNLTTTYQFDSVGEHVIKFEFNNPTIVGYNAPIFYNLTTVKRVVIPNTFTAIGNNAFNGCSGLISVTIGNGVTSIGNQAFTGCGGLISIEMPNGVTSIGNSAFYNCNSLTSMSIPDSVTTIDDYAFNGCTSLSSIAIGNGVTSIGQAAFYNCSGLTSVTVEATTPPALTDDNAFSGTNNCPIYVPESSVTAYKNASIWSYLSSRIQAIPTT